MCEYCEPSNTEEILYWEDCKPVMGAKCEREMLPEDVTSYQSLLLCRKKTSKTHHRWFIEPQDPTDWHCMFERVPVNYCPMCGRKLT